MALDIFGNKLYTGDVVVFADANGHGEAVLETYEVEEVIDGTTIKGLLMSGEYVGNSFYLQGTEKRCSLIRNVYKTADASKYDTLH